MTSFRPASVELSHVLDSTYRKQHGVFFTPKSIRDVLLQTSPCVSSDMQILEPSMGSGEFVSDLIPHVKRIIGIEYSEVIIKQVQPVFESVSNVHLIHTDFLEYDFGSERFDQIIGNPPYFQITTNKSKYRERYPILGGKFDIYILFILKGLELLRPGGVLKLIIPSTFLSTDSYEPVRRLISSRYLIHEILDFSKNKDWLHTTQKTVGLIIENRDVINTDNAFFKIYLPDCYLHPRDAIQKLKELLLHSEGQTISGMGFSIKTGEVVWNTVKDKLTDDSSKALLVHNSYLKNNSLVVPDKRGSRPLFIDYDPVAFITEPVILVNRGNGNNGNLRIAFVYFDPSAYPSPAIAENHVYKIYDNGRQQLFQLYQSLCDPQTTQFIQTCIGSGFITKRFIQQLPVFTIR